MSSSRLRQTELSLDNGDMTVSRIVTDTTDEKDKSVPVLKRNRAQRQRKSINV